MWEGVGVWVCVDKQSDSNAKDHDNLEEEQSWRTYTLRGQCVL